MPAASPDERRHDTIRDLVDRSHDERPIPWATPPEIDYLLRTHVALRAQDAF